MIRLFLFLFCLQATAQITNDPNWNKDIDPSCFWKVSGHYKTNYGSHYFIKTVNCKLIQVNDPSNFRNFIIEEGKTVDFPVSLLGGEIVRVYFNKITFSDNRDEASLEVSLPEYPFFGTQKVNFKFDNDFKVRISSAIGSIDAFKSDNIDTSRKADDVVLVQTEVGFETESIKMLDKDKILVKKNHPLYHYTNNPMIVELGKNKGHFTVDQAKAILTDWGAQGGGLYVAADAKSSETYGKYLMRMRPSKDLILRKYEYRNNGKPLLSPDIDGTYEYYGNFGNGNGVLWININSVDEMHNLTVDYVGEKISLLGKHQYEKMFKEDENYFESLVSSDQIEAKYPNGRLDLDDLSWVMSEGSRKHFSPPNFGYITLGDLIKNYFSKSQKKMFDKSSEIKPYKDWLRTIVENQKRNVDVVIVPTEMQKVFKARYLLFFVDVDKKIDGRTVKDQLDRIIKIQKIDLENL